MGGHLPGRAVLKSPSLFPLALALLLFSVLAAGAEAPLPPAAEPPHRELPAAVQSFALPILQGRPLAPVFSPEFPEHPAVEESLRRYLQQDRKSLAAALGRMSRYRGFIDSNLRASALPPELLYLPLLESRYSARAVSRSGAVGLWQIMRNTSGALGLASDEWVDERRDFWKSTEGALRKLAENREHFGDWCLALAAYNCGTGRLRRAIASSGIRDFWSLRERGLLRKETAEYVPAFLALARLASSPGLYGLPLGWETSPVWERVRLERSVDLGLLADALGVSRELLREANAELKLPVTPPDPRGYWLKVPAGLSGRVSALLADPHSELLKHRYHRLASGDTFYGLARRFGVGQALIQAANPGLDPRRLAIGGIVRIPVLGAADGPPAAGAVAAAAAPPRPAAPRADFTASYLVQRGDTLWSIARWHGTTVEELAAANGRALDDLLKPGETLKVPPRPPVGAAEGGAE